MPRIENYPIKVMWDGWETTTQKLQAAGWSIAAEESVFEGGIRLALRHPSGEIYALTEVASMRYGLGVQEMLNFMCGVGLRVNQMANRIQVHVMGDMSTFNPVDGTPMEVDKQILSLDDCKIFRPLQKSTELIIDPADVNRAMDVIINMQSPKQKEIREKKRKEWRKFNNEFNQTELTAHMQPTTEIVAQLVTV